MMKSGVVRQVSPDISGIDESHKQRYRWARKGIPVGKSIIDAGCGVGYGSWILAQFHEVIAYDVEPEAIAYAKRHYPHPNVSYRVEDLGLHVDLPPCYAAVCFEMLEHEVDYAIVLNNLVKATDVLFCSVPNEETIPWNPDRYSEHLRHYTEDQFIDTLEKAGWEIEQLYGQRSKQDPKIRPTTVDCQVMLAKAVRA